jgi:hypothetical protein
MSKEQSARMVSIVIRKIRCNQLTLKMRFAISLPMSSLGYCHRDMIQAVFGEELLYTAHAPEPRGTYTLKGHNSAPSVESTVCFAKYQGQ